MPGIYDIFSTKCAIFSVVITKYDIWIMVPFYDERYEVREAHWTGCTVKKVYPPKVGTKSGVPL